jgi:hypothetical protein
LFARHRVVARGCTTRRGSNASLHGGRPVDGS